MDRKTISWKEKEIHQEIINNFTYSWGGERRENGLDDDSNGTEADSRGCTPENEESSV